MKKNVPNYLSDYKDLWNLNPHKANLEWFKNANYGLFIHYGLYSLLGKGEWVQYHDRIPVVEYAKLKENFRAEKFDANFITDLALDVGMKYVNLVTCHHDSFCLWDSKTERFNSVNSPCKRDLVRELAVQCDKKGLGFFVYYTFMLNWRHPYFLSREYFEPARPDYKSEQPEYKFRSLNDYPKYIEYMLSCIKELMELEYPVAGIWLDIVKAFYFTPELVPVKETYELVRKIRPEALIAYKNGATGEEDFASPEFNFESQGDIYRRLGLSNEAALRADKAWDLNKNKHNEICMTLQKDGLWGYNIDSEHYTSDELKDILGYALKNKCNLLANVGPLPDGSILPEDIKALKKLGGIIKKEGWPEENNNTQLSNIQNKTDNAATAV